MEVVISSLLVGTVVVGSLEMLGASVRTQTVCHEFADGPTLADSMLAEIMSLPYEDPENPGLFLGTDSGESASTRDQFDDVDDYAGWSANPPQSKIGNVLTEYNGWQRSITVNYATRLNGNISLLPLIDPGLKRIEVTVTSPTGAVTKRFGLRWKAGSLEQAPTVDRTVVTQIESTLSVGTPTTTVSGVTNLLNHVEVPNP